jgi:hypothetical protein
MFYFKKDIDEMHRKVEGSLPTDPSNLSLLKLNLCWYEVPSGTRFKYYHSSSKRDIIPGEGGSVVAKLRHGPKFSTTCGSAGYYFYKVEHEPIYYYLCLFRDNLILIESREIRIIQPKKAKKK